MDANTPAVYDAIAFVAGELAKAGISKDHRNTQGQGYQFRGIDDVYNAIGPLLPKAKLCILPRVLKREITERQSKQGGALFYIVVEAEFDFVSAKDGSKHTVKTFGEAMDSGDKATNKAMSAAYKYACIQAFCIPTEGDNDADSSTHDVKPAARKLHPKVQAALDAFRLALGAGVTEGERAKLVRDWAEKASANQRFYQAVCAELTEAELSDLDVFTENKQAA